MQIFLSISVLKKGFGKDDDECLSLFLGPPLPHKLNSNLVDLTTKSTTAKCHKRSEFCSMLFMFQLMLAGLEQDLWKIINGERASPHEFPFMVTLKILLITVLNISSLKFDGEEKEGSGFWVNWAPARTVLGPIYLKPFCGSSLRSTKAIIILILLDYLHF